MNHLEFIKKVVRVRQYLIRSGKNHKDQMRQFLLLGKVDKFLCVNPTPAGAAKWLKANASIIDELIPGDTCSSGKTLRNQLNTLINE